MANVRYRREAGDPAIAGEYMARQGSGYPHQGEVGAVVQIGSDVYALEGRPEIAGFGKKLKKLGRKVEKGVRKVGKAAEKVGKQVAPMALQAGGMLLGGPAGGAAAGALSNAFFGSDGGSLAPSGGFGNLLPGVAPGLPLWPTAAPDEAFAATDAGPAKRKSGGGAIGWLLPVAIGVFILMPKGKG